MWEIAVAGTLLGLVVVEGLEFFERVMHFAGDRARTSVRVTYVENGEVAFEQIAETCALGGMATVAKVEVRRRDTDPPVIDASFEIDGGGPSRPGVVDALLALPGVMEVSVAER
jgi:hypothetical protein